MAIDRSEAIRAMAKAIAYKACGKDVEAAQWARELAARAREIAPAHFGTGREL